MGSFWCAPFASASYSGLLIGWDSSEGTDQSDFAVPGITGSLFINEARTIHADSNSQDGTFGSAHPGASISSPPYIEGVWSVGLGGRSDHEGARPTNRLVFRIENHTRSDVTLEAIHFDAVRRWSQAGTQLSLYYASGDLNIPERTLIATTPDGAIPLVGENNVERISSNWADFDISLDGLRDVVLRPRQGATFWLEVVPGGHEHQDIMVDNIGISGRANVTVRANSNSPDVRPSSGPMLTDSFADLSQIHRMSGENAFRNSRIEADRAIGNDNLRIAGRNPWNTTETMYVVYDLQGDIEWATVLAHVYEADGDIRLYASPDDENFVEIPSDWVVLNADSHPWQTWLFRANQFPENSRYLKVESRSVDLSPAWRISMGEVRINHPRDAAMDVNPIARPEPPPPPVAESVLIAGRTFLGETLSGNYSYTHEDNLAEGATRVRWLSSASAEGTFRPIRGQDNSSLQIELAHVGRYIKFQVIPVDSEGLEGEVARSEAFGPIQAEGKVQMKTIILNNPYGDADWDTMGIYKANLHCHTRRSDGASQPAEMIDAYRERGYHILAITDHDYRTQNAYEKVTYPWQDYGRDPEELGMVAIPGQEISNIHHLLSLFNEWPGHGTGSVERALNEIGNHGGLAVWAHPNIYWSVPNRQGYSLEWYLESYHDYSHLVGFEIFNGHYIGPGRPNDHEMWDNILVELLPDRQVWGFGNDDAHSIRGIGTGYNKIVTAELTQAAVREAIEKGRFFATSTNIIPDLEGPAPKVTSFVVNENEGTIQLTAENYSEIHWISGNEIVHKGSTLDIENQALRDVRVNFVRAAVWGPGGVTMTQPVTLGYDFALND